MKTISIYQQCKKELKNYSTIAKQKYPNDKLAQRMYLNGAADYICKNYGLSNYQRNNLELYCCTLHPKD